MPNDENAFNSSASEDSDLAGSRQIGLNDSGTCEASDTPATQPRSRRVRGFVYFIGCGEHIKIGFSTRPLDRLRALQTSHPNELEILGTQKGTRSLESRLHKRFDDIRVRGEWFEASDALWSYIDNHTIERAATPPELSPEAKAMMGPITRLRNEVEAETPMGHVCSNLLEQIPNMATYVRPAWATHESQTLPGLIKQQMEHLGRLLAERRGALSLPQGDRA